MKAYKGFNKDMTCRGFQYEERKTYETKKAVCCEAGFHACEDPLDCFRYYSPNESEYHEVECDGNIDNNDDDSKIACTKIKIGGKVNIAGIVKATIEYRKEKIKSAIGNYEASSATGYRGASSATGYRGASSATGDCGASSATGNYGASSATGYRGASSATGNCGASSATGYRGASSAENPTAVAVAWGYHSKAKGVIGAYLVFADWYGDENDINNPEVWTLNGAKMVQVDGETIKADTWYTMRDGEIIEVEDD